jgi:serine/threonine-protein kinase
MSSKALADGVDVGTVVANTYKIVSILGRGGMGTVWEAHHQRLPGKRVAIKVLHPSVAEDGDALARFRREAEIACRLGHPNIVEVHDFNSLDDGTPYLILELLEGESLDERLKKGAISVDECEQILRQVASALQSAHEQGVVHRDLKPQNIFLVPSPTGVGPEIVKVLDFGISKIHGSQTVKTQESTLLGTPQYMAPEQATGQHDSVDATTDLFALAVMLYELLSNRAAFPGLNIPEVVYKVVHVDPAPITEYLPNLPAEKAAALHKAMSKAQGDRFGSVAEFVLAFTGEALAATRARVTPAPSDIAKASTMASGMLAAGSAATVDSQKMATSAGTNVGDIANAATLDSQKTNLAAAMAATIDSGTIDRKSTQMTAQPATPASTQMAAASPPRRMPSRSTLAIAFASMAALGVVAWVAIPAGSQTASEHSAPIAQSQAEVSDTSGPAQDLDRAKPRAEEEVTKGAGESEAVTEEASAETPNVEDTDADDAPEEEVAPEEELAPARVDSANKHRAKAESVTPKLRRGSGGGGPPPPPPPSSSPDRSALATLLTQAQQQLNAKEYERAIATAKRAYKVQRQTTSWAIKVKAKCHLADLSNANGALRNIPKKQRALRRSLQAYCTKLGHPLNM